MHSVIDFFTPFLSYKLPRQKSISSINNYIIFVVFRSNLNHVHGRTMLSKCLGKMKGGKEFTNAYVQSLPYIPEEKKKHAFLSRQNYDP